jgi:hypothetical protein
MARKFFFITTLCTLWFSGLAVQASAQSNDLPKFEAAADFTSITKPDFDGGRTEPGFGGRFTYNIRKNIAVEAAGYFFPHRCQTCTSDNSGNISQALFGAKIGKRFNRWGIFGKARPGVVSFSEGAFDVVPLASGGPFPFTFQNNRLTNFALDVGGVIEFYPTKRIVTRFDAGDTMIVYRQRTSHFLTQDPTTLKLSLVPFTIPSETRHNFQFIASVGFRF